MAKASADESRLGSLEKLLVLSLIRHGLKQDHVAAALGMHRTSLSRAFPKGVLAEVGRLAGKKQEDEDGQQAG
jgi:hypothetical protein